MESYASIGTLEIARRAFHLQWQFLYFLIAFLMLSGCGANQNLSLASGTKTAPRTLAIAATLAIASTRTAVPVSTLPPIRSPTLLTNASGLCAPVSGGTMSGEVTQAGKPVPTGTGLGADLNGGPYIDVRTSNGRYALPLLAQKCPDGFRWVAFILRVGSEGYYITPNSTALHRDFDLAPTSIISIASFPTCNLAFGTVRGQLLLRGKLAPDGTPVLAARVGRATAYPYADPDQDYLTQKVFTQRGTYSLVSVGLECENGRLKDGRFAFAPMTLFAPGASIPITPTQQITIQDIAIP